MKLILTDKAEIEVTDDYSYSPLHVGAKTLEDVPEKYVEATKKAYLDLYGKELI